MTATHTFIVTVTGCDAEQAEQVMGERLLHDEGYGFDYKIDYAPSPLDRDALEERAAQHPDAPRPGRALGPIRVTTTIEPTSVSIDEADLLLRRAARVLEARLISTETDHESIRISIEVPDGTLQAAAMAMKQIITLAAIGDPDKIVVAESIIPA